MDKSCVEFNKKRREVEQNGDKDGKMLYKLMNNAAYGKTMENMRNNPCKTLKQENRLFEIAIETKPCAT